MTQRRYLRYLPAAGVAAACLLAIGIVYLIKEWLGSDPGTPPPRLQQVTLIVPPPPPPKIEEPPPEPEIREPVDVPEPQAQEPEAPASADLGVDADGSAGGDGFGLRAKKGGRDLLDGGPFGWYSGIVRADFRALLNEDKRLRRARYSAVLGVWLAADGRVERVEIIDPTGDRKLDETLRLVVVGIGRVSEPPPPEMPQPVRLRVSSARL